MITISISELEELMDGLSSDGICTACGNIQSDCEPDARNYVCEDCEEPRVFGMEQAVLEMLVDIGE